MSNILESTIDVTVVSGGVGGSSDSFKTIAVSGQSDVVADSATDTLTLVAGTNVTITTNASTDTITISSTGGGDAYSIAYAATVTPNWDSGSVLNVGTLTGNVFLANPTGTPVDGQRLTIRLNQDGNGGRAISFDTGYGFSSVGDLTASDLSTVPNAKNRIAFQYNSATSKAEAVGLVRL